MDSAMTHVEGEQAQPRWRRWEQRQIQPSGAGDAWEWFSEEQAGFIVLSRKAGIDRGLFGPGATFGLWAVRAGVCVIGALGIEDEWQDN